MPLPLIIHERLNQWARQIRPRVLGRSVRVVESRSLDDLRTAARRSASPLVLIDLGNRPAQGLEAVDCASQAAPQALILVFDPESHPEVSLLARELGASHILSGLVVPPTLMAWIDRWIPLAEARARASGWAEDRAPEPEPWEKYLESPGPAPGPL